jgi:MarR family transcriptional regulator, lower aerobic nicotinate degradation pathway regulator
MTTAPEIDDIASVLYGRPGFLLRRAHQISVSIFESACAHLGITPAQYAVLTVLAVDGNLNQSSVARAIGLDKVTVSLLLRGLEARGLVQRSALEHNRRVRRLALTPKAIEVMRQWRQPAEEAYEKLMAPFSPRQRQTLADLLHRLVTELEHCARAPLQPLQGRPASAALDSAHKDAPKPSLAASHLPS